MNNVEFAFTLMAVLGAITLITALIVTRAPSKKNKHPGNKNLS